MAGHGKASQNSQVLSFPRHHRQAILVSPKDGVLAHKVQDLGLNKAKLVLANC